MCHLNYSQPPMLVFAVFFLPLQSRFAHELILEAKMDISKIILRKRINLIFIKKYFSFLISFSIPKFTTRFLNMFNKQLDSEDFYTSPEGYIVFTEKYHLKRGYCCKSGCKHCPYGYNKKTGKFEPQKSSNNEDKK